MINLMNQMTSSQKTFRILLVDDHKVVRLGVKHLLEIEDHLTVVAEASSAEEALSWARTGSCDIVITDLSLQDQDGIWLIGALKQVLPGVPVIVLTMHSDDRMVLEALKAGACGYVTKSATREELLAAVEAAGAGENYIHPSVAAPIFKVLRSEGGNEDGMTNREREIILLAASGLNNHEIALSLMLSVSTVKTHMRAILGKLDAKDRTQAVLEAVRRGIVPAPKVR
jgi:DNA-binding NarL/FixJ family response regulator